MANTPTVQTFYTPFPENQVFTALDTINSEAASPVDTYISIAASADNTIIYYDQWEDGYEADISNPVQSTTQIWGDGNPANGSAPGLIGDVIKAGNVIVLKQPNINVATLQSVIDFDGRDKFGATKTVVVTRAAWADVTNTLLASALEVYDTNNWGTSYRVPVGENLPTGSGTDTQQDRNIGADNDMFEYTGLVIMASKNGTVVNIDADGNGTAETKVTLAEGESYLVNGGVNAGATVNGSKPIQVDLITGDRDARFESRSFTLFPTDQLSNSYYTPVGTKAVDPTYVFTYNPGTTNITIQWASKSATGSYVLEAGKTEWFPVKENEGVHVFSTSNFYALATVDSDAGNNSDHEWGNTLIPQNRLTSQVLIGLGLGRDPTSTVNPTENSAPVWVTPVGNGGSDVEIYVDYNGDGLGSKTDPNGFKYDALIKLKELENARIYDPDGDQTGMLLYVLKPGVKLAAAWGQDPSTASTAQPALDLGTTIPPLPEFAAGKNGVLFDNPNTPGVDGDKDGNGVVSPGDTLLYTINILNTSRVPVPNVRLSEIIPDDTTYVPNTVQIDYGNGQGFRAIKDDSIGTPFPLDGSGLNLNSDITTGTEPGSLPTKGQFTVTFQVQIDDFANLTPGTNSIVNNAVVSALGTDLKISDDTPLNFNVSGTVWEDSNGNGLQDNGELGKAGVSVTLLGGNTVTTDTKGNYIFSGLKPGQYQLQFAKPVGFNFTTADAGSNDALDSDANQTTGLTPTFTLTSGGSADFDAGIVRLPPVLPPSTSVGDRVWNDLNGNGLQDTGEPGVPGVTVILTGGGTDGLLNSVSNNTTVTTITNADGLYRFFPLNFGEEYQLTFTNLPSVYGGVTTPKVGSNGAIDSDAIPSGTINNPSGTTPIFTLAQGQVNNDLDVGLLQNPSLLVNSLDAIFMVDEGRQESIDTLNAVGTANGKGNAIFLSDGFVSENPNSFANEVNEIENIHGQNLRALGMGQFSDLSKLDYIDSIANNTPGAAPFPVQFTNNNDLLPAFSFS